MKILNCTIEDVEDIFKLYRLATDFQKIKFPDNQWPPFSENLIKTEINDHRQWKILIDNKIACIWAIAFHDPQIWEERDIDPAIYIHRIATNPDFRGLNFVFEIVKWAKEYAISKNKLFIRMDTCGNNEKLIHHYVNCGFNFLGFSRPKDTDGLPSHYENADVCLFEIPLNNSTAYNIDFKKENTT